MPDTPDDTPAHDQPTGQVTPDAGLAQPAPANGPTLGIAEAVRATGTSRSTLQRRLKAGEIPGAHHGPDGTWRIPIAGLIAAGLMDRATPADSPAPSSPAPVPVEPETVAELGRLRAEVDRLRAERDLAHALAAERERNLEDLRAALAVLSRALPAGPVSSAGEPAPSPAPADGAAPVARRRWWRRT